MGGFATTRAALAIAALALLAACGRIVPPSQPPSPPRPEIAADQPLSRGPAVSSLILSQTDAAAALASFAESCDALQKREDASGLTQTGDWLAACNSAARWPAAEALQFFAFHFDTLRVGDGAAFATGYYEPEIHGSRTHAPGYDVPIYAMPTDLVRAWPDDTPAEERDGRPPLGRYDADGDFVPYFERAEIEDGALQGGGLEIAWAADPVEFFFLQIQGSGLLRLPDGSLMRIGYAGQNGREYVAIGRVMRERGLIGEEPGQYPGTMQGLMQYLRDNPVEGREMMQLNKSWIFFRELTTDGPLGALSVPVRRESSVAADPNFVPLGAPVWLDLDRDVADGMWIAQDTGGAIKGANRFDTFWGNGEDARLIAGGMSGRGQALLLLPKVSVARLLAQ